MKLTTIVILMLGIISCGEKTYSNKDFIRIEHNGPSDKLITVIVISVNEIPKQVEWENHFVVSHSLFLDVENLVLKQNMSHERDYANEWAVFKITTFISASTNIYQLKSQEDSNAFFANLSKLLADSADPSSK